MNRTLRRFALVLSIALLWPATRMHSTAGTAAQAHHGSPVPLHDVHITPVQGPSWLQHLGRPMDESSMGQTGLWGPSPVQEEGAAPYKVPVGLQDTMTMTAADIFRLS